MSWDNRIIWSEGTFLQPQHFQQHDRHLEGQLEQRARALRAHGYGFLEIAVDESLLELGKLALRSARGESPRQRRTLRALGLGKIGRSEEHDVANPAIAGMLRKVRHLVKIDER